MNAYLLLEGSLRVMSRGEDRTLAIVGAPALVGEMAAVQDHQRSATVVADTPCTVLRIPGSELRTLMTRQPLFATAMRERATCSPRSLPQAPKPDPRSARRDRRRPRRAPPPRELASEQVIEGHDDDLYLVRRGAIENLGDGARAMPGDFVQRQRGERYAGRRRDLDHRAAHVGRGRRDHQHQERVREIATRLVDRARVKAAPVRSAVRVPDLGGSLVHDAGNRVVVSENVARCSTSSMASTMSPPWSTDSHRDARGDRRGSRVLVAAGLADIRV